ncbi:MAG: hypothetical protein Q9166_005929 [cf. Caloplaca sp. 2 TL-2023]
MSQRNLRPQPPQAEVRDIYILVMGLTGAGKSTFISIVTENDTIPIGEPGDLDSVTNSVQDYLLDIRRGNVIYRVHLIDSPGFDDSTAEDIKVLTRIADYINLHYKLGSTLAGILYLHDIMKPKMGGVGQRNLRMLEEMVGIGKWDNCTLVTTKWGCTTDPEGEEAREKTLMTNDNYFGAMLTNSHQASMKRFDPKSKVASHLEELEKIQGEKEELEEAHQLLGRKFDMEIFDKFKRSRDKLLREQQIHRISRWATRTTIVGGAIAATVVTFGPGAAAFALEPAFETYATKQRNDDQAKMNQLQKNFEKESQTPLKHASEFDSAWLRDRRVKSIGDLSDNYSIRSSSSMDLSAVETVTEVATEMAKFSIKDSNLP